MTHLLPHRFSLVIALILGVCAHLRIQPQDCTPGDLAAALKPADKAFDLARDLSEDLQRGGFEVRCMLRSHWENMFEGQAGAALYRTNRGDFEALFLAPPNTFDRLIVREGKEGDRWAYSFEGAPKPWPANRVEGRKTLFMKNAHRLLIVWDDEQLAASLRRAIGVR